MQRFFGLPPSGELNQETLLVMKRPRCGLSDVERFGETIRWKKHTLSYRLELIRNLCSTDVTFTEKQACPSSLNDRLKCNLFLRIAGYNLTIPASQIHKLFRTAWKLWSNVAPIQFRKRSRREADIVISFHSGGEL